MNSLVRVQEKLCLQFEGHLSSVFDYPVTPRSAIKSGVNYFTILDDFLTIELPLAMTIY